MSLHKNPDIFAREWINAFNAQDVNRILALYDEDVEFLSPRLSGNGGDGFIRGKAAVENYLRETFELRPNLRLTLGTVFAGVDSIALEFRIEDRLHGIEFMRFGPNGKICFACGNYVKAPPPVDSV